LIGKRKENCCYWWGLYWHGGGCSSLQLESWHNCNDTILLSSVLTYLKHGFLLFMHFKWQLYN
jgi:hypothetical protein